MSHFDQKRMDYSEKGHRVAQKTIYPIMFPNKRIEFESTSLGTSAKNTVLDGKLGVDRIVHVYATQKSHRAIPFTIQERFRDPKSIKERQNVTLRFECPNGELQEFYKMCGLYFVYGVYDEPRNIIYWAHAINTVKMMHALIYNKLKSEVITPKNPTECTFVSVQLSDLRKLGFIAASYKNHQIKR